MSDVGKGGHSSPGPTGGNTGEARTGGQAQDAEWEPELEATDLTDLLNGPGTPEGFGGDAVETEVSLEWAERMGGAVTYRK